MSETTAAAAHDHDHAGRLIRMANQIAQFFASHPAEEGVAGVAAHINQFWDPRMRQRFLAASAERAAELHPLAARALPQVKR